MSSIALAVIGGTGLYRLASFTDVETFELETVYGMPSGPVRVGSMGGHRIAFLARHGEGHSLPPHRVNYRANLRCLKDLGVERVLAINAVGGISDRFSPRVIAMPDQIIDYTWGRISTFCEDPGTPVQHVDFGEPYSENFRQEILAAARQLSIPVVNGGCYGATQGPRLETRAEITRMHRDGCDMVGMTGMPEAALARELGLEYACLAIVANWAAGCGSLTPETSEITLDEVLANVDAATRSLPPLLTALVG